MSKKPFIHLHNHSDFSLLDGAQTCKEMAETVASLGHTHVALTDHGTMRGFYKFHHACKDVGVKPIFGFEAYMCKDRLRRGITDEEKAQITKGITNKREQNAAIKEMEEKLGTRRRFHSCLWAKDDVGLKNLFRLSSIGWQEGFYYRPRIDMEALSRHTEGVMFSTSCVSGVLAVPFMMGDIEEVMRLLGELQKLFGDDLYLEIMPHDFDEQVKVNLATVHIAESLGIQIIATNDAHYALKGDYLRHEVSLCMQSKDVWSNPNRWKFTGTGFYLRSREEMEAEFAKEHPKIPSAVVQQALDTTYELALKATAEVKIDRHACLLPPVQITRAHHEGFLEWASNMYPEFYSSIGDEKDLPPDASCCNPAGDQAPSAADDCEHTHE